MKQLTTITLLLITSFSTAQVVSNFAASDSAGCMPLSVSFTNMSVNANQYSWDFDNGSGSILENPTAVFTMPGNYTITLISENGSTADTSIFLITVFELPTASFSFNLTGTCEGDNLVSFSNTSIGADTCIWDFGDGGSGNDYNPIHSYNAANTYYPSLLVTSEQGCSNLYTSFTPVTIQPKPVIDYNAQTTSVCGTDTIFQFTENCLGANYWNWEFGDGTTSLLQNPTHQYNATGWFDVQLIAHTAHGCSDTLLLEDYIIIKEQPSPEFTISNTSGCEPLQVEFEPISTAAYRGIWDYGDGSALDTTDVGTRTYDAGVYNIYFEIKLPNGCTSDTLITAAVESFATPVSLFGVSDTAGCAPLNVAFMGPAGIYQYNWEFGDGTSSAIQNPLHTYIDGQYLPNLTITDTNGCSSETEIYVIHSAGLNLSATHNATINCAPQTVNFGATGASQYFWDFGDGNTSNLSSIPHNYTTNGTYAPLVIGYNSVGCSDTVRLDSVVLGPPDYTQLSTDTLFGCVADQATFSFAGIGYNSWLWNFGDGITSMLQNPIHSYTNAGTYIVQLTTETIDGCQFTIPNYRIVMVEEFNPDYNWTEVACDSNLTISFNASGAGATSWFWNFGDSVIANTQNPQHTYQNIDGYLVEAVATSSYGCQVSALLPIGGTCPGPSGTAVGISPSAAMGGSTTIDYSLSNHVPICAPQLIQLTSPFANRATYFWDFGDGTTTLFENPSHTYSLGGNFTITHIATDSTGISDTLILVNFIVLGNGNANFTMALQPQCNDKLVQFSSVNSSIVNQWWEFGDGAIDSIPTPTHVYSGGNNIYFPKLTLIDSSGCEYENTSTLYTTEQLFTFIYDSLICFNETIVINHNIPSGYTTNWDFGDGTISSTPNHVYGSMGIYTISVEITDLTGCIQTIALPYQVKVWLPDATFSILDNTIACDFVDVDFAANNAQADSYMWQFMTDTASTAIAGYTFTQPGSHDVSLTVIQNGCANSTTQYQAVTVNQANAEIVATQSSMCYPFSVHYEDAGTGSISWDWSFPNGDSPTTPTHDQTYTQHYHTGDDVILVVSDSNGCVAYDTLMVPRGMKLRLRSTPTTGCAPHDVTFDDLYTENASTGWLWDFGDGSTSTDSIPTHTYTSAGLFDVSLIRTATGGCADTILVPNWVEIVNPIADFTVNSIIDCSPVLADMTNLSTGNTDHTWHFGDGGTSVINNPSHIYNTPGTYYPMLVVSHPLGCTDTAIATTPVIVQGPTVSFTWSDSIACNEIEVQFVNQTSDATNYEWNFGNGQTSTDINPTFTFDVPGMYDITLIAEDTSGCVEVLSLPDLIVVAETPTAHMSISDSIGCSPMAVYLTHTSGNYDNVNWNLGNGTTSVNDSIVEVYNTPGVYNISLIATNNYGCADTANSTVTVLDSVDVTIVPVSPLCTSQVPLQLVATGSSGIWTGTGITDSITGMFDPSLTGAGSFMVYNTVQGACNGIDSTLITVIQSEYAAIDLVQPVCENAGIIQLTAADSGGTWSGTGITDITAGVFDPAYAGNGMHIVHYQIPGICGDHDSVPVIVLQQPVAEIDLVVNGSCSPAIAELTASNNPVTGSEYHWYQNGIEVFSVSDTTFSLPGGTHYFNLLVTTPEGCSATTNSDTIFIYDSTPLPAPEIVRSTVLNNESVFTEWHDSLMFNPDLSHYALFRSQDQLNYTYLLSLQPYESSYLDFHVNVHEQNYSYYLVAINQCGNASNGSLISSSILLDNTEVTNGTTRLIWTDYKEWDTGVDYYEIQVLNQFGEWETVTTTESTDVQVVVE